MRYGSSDIAWALLRQPPAPLVPTLQTANAPGGKHFPRLLLFAADNVPCRLIVKSLRNFFAHILIPHINIAHGWSQTTMCNALPASGFLSTDRANAPAASTSAAATSSRAVLLVSRLTRRVLPWSSFLTSELIGSLPAETAKTRQPRTARLRPSLSAP